MGQCPNLKLDKTIRQILTKELSKVLQKNQTFTDRLLLIANDTLRQIMGKEIRILILEELPARAALIEGQEQCEEVVRYESVKMAIRG